MASNSLSVKACNVSVRTFPSAAREASRWRILASLSAPRQRKRKAKPDTPVGKRELMAPRLQDFPSSNSPL